MGQYSVIMNNKIFYNCREKYITTPDGGQELVEVFVCRRPVFNPEGLELFHKWESTPCEVAKSDKWDRLERRKKARPDLFEPTADEIKGELHTLKRENEEKRKRAQRRAKTKVFDYIIANNDLDLFVTLTLDGDKIDRNNYADVIKKFNTWCDNFVRRKGLKYVCVPEHHKDGAIHFHLLTNQVFDLVSSGTFLPPVGSGKRKPLKRATLERYGYDISACQEVFNLPAWKLGFTTAMVLQGDRQRCAGYVGKYITKTTEKVGGRYYLHGGNLAKPTLEYSVVDFDAFVDSGYYFEVPGNEYVIIR